MNILKCYPSGRLTASSRKKFKPEQPVKPRTISDEERWWLTCARVHGIEKTLSFMASIAPDRSGEDASAPLGLSSVSNSTKGVKRRGRKGITSRARQQVRDGCALMEQIVALSTLSFLTLTLPSHVCECVTSDAWSYALHLMRKKLVYHLKKAGLLPHIVGATEIQEKRYRATGKIGLHVHWVFQGRQSKSAWCFSPEQLQEWWSECWDEILGEHQSISWDASVRIERVRKSAVGYLGKYMSKGTQVVKEVIENGDEDKLPYHWSVCTMELKRFIKRETWQVSGSQAERVFDALMSSLSHLLRFSKFVEVNVGENVPMKVGWYGELKDRSLRAELESLLRPSKVVAS